MNLFRLMLPLALCCVAGSAAAGEPEAPAPKRCKAYVVSNAHLDTQWNWDVRTTIREYIPRTLFQNLYLMERFPEYRFSFEGGVKYAWMKEYYPLQYEQLKKRIASGQWHIAGASWDANDPNMPSAESFFRNVLLGQEFYKREFGVLSTDIFLPDCFGFGYTLPTIAAHCGLIGMSTQKLGWRTHDFYDALYHRKNPFSWGVWQGIDGESVIAAFDTGGYSEELPENVQYDAKLLERAKHGFENTCYHYYAGGGEGVGDRGNSGTVATCRRLAKAMADADAPIEIVSAVSDDLYRDFLDRKSELPVYDGELLMDVHATGCYTSQTAMKYYNRRNEELAGAAERASVAADWLGVAPYDSGKLNEIWQRFIWHQFHDDLTGTSIPEAYTFSWNDELIALRQSTDVMTTAVAALSYELDTRVKGIPVVVYNAVTERVRDVVEALVPLDARARGVAVYGPDGRRTPAQVIGREGGRARILFAADVPSAGYAVYDVRPGAAAKSAKLAAAGNVIENSVYRLELDANGDVASLVDKRCGRELVADGKAFRLALFEGNPSVQWPAWEVLKEVIDKAPRAVDGSVRISVAEPGPVRATLKVERTFGDSRFTQYVSLTEGAQDDRIDVRTTVDWNTRDALLKAEFPMAVANPKAAYDLGIGYIERGNNTATAYEVPALKWADLTAADGSYGITILNDCKYGWDKPADNTLRLTLIHTPGVKNRYAHQKDLDLGVDHFTYSIVGHEGPLSPRAAATGEQLNLPLTAYVAPEHAGRLGRSFSMIRSSTPALGIRALKKAEDGDGYIVRCYNLTGVPVDGQIEFPAEIISAETCNGIEQATGPASFAGRVLKVSAGKFAPRTYRVRLAAPSGKPALEGRDKPVALPFNATLFTTDEFYTYYRFDRERGTYAAELIPETLTCRGVPFRLGEENADDAVHCAGQTIAIPAGYRKLYLLVAAADKACDAVFCVGDAEQRVHVPLWKGFYGQWGWRGYSEPQLRDATLAHVGTHRHRGDVGNLPYDFSYMYRVALTIPDGATSVTLPDDRNVAVFAATASDGRLDEVQLVTETFIRPDAK